jgi:hypothetical protein
VSPVGRFRSVRMAPANSGGMARAMGPLARPRGTGDGGGPAHPADHEFRDSRPWNSPTPGHRRVGRWASFASLRITRVPAAQCVGLVREYRRALRSGATGGALSINRLPSSAPTVATGYARTVPETLPDARCPRPHSGMDQHERCTVTQRPPRAGFSLGPARGARLPRAVDRATGLQHRQLDADGGRTMAAGRAQRRTGDPRSDSLQPPRRPVGPALGRAGRPLRTSRSAAGRTGHHSPSQPS